MTPPSTDQGQDQTRAEPPRPAALGVYGMLKEAVMQWSAERAPRMAAALAFYTIFSIAPLLVIVVGLTGFVLGGDQVEERIASEMESLVGSEGGKAMRELLATSVHSEDEASSPGILAAVVGILTLLFGSSGVFAELQDSLNTIWDVKAKSAGGLMAAARRRFSSFVMVFGTGFMLLVSLVVSSALSALTEYAGASFPVFASLLHVVDFALSFVFVALLFALIYRFVPDAKIAWADVWPGAMLSSLLFGVGKVLIGLYVGRSAFASAYGAAGSLVVILLWVYFAAQVLFLGAELTQVYGTRRHAVPPTADARRAVNPAKLEVHAEGQA